LIFSPKYPIAFDIGIHDIHVLQLEKSRGRFRIRTLLYQKLERGLTDIGQGEPDLLKALRRIKKKGRFLGNRAVIHVPAHRVLSFPVEFTVKGNESIEALIIREVEQNLPYPIEEAVIDYPSISKLPKGNLQKAIIVSVKRRDIEDILKVFRKAGFQADAMDFRPISSICLHQYLFSVSDKPSVICYVGREESSVQIFNNEHILAMNNFSWGLGRLIHKLNANLGFDETSGNALNLLAQYGIQSRPLKNNAALSPGEQGEDPDGVNTGRIVSRIITPAIEELVFEFHKIIGYTRNKEAIHGINDISFYGVAPMIKGLDHYIQNRMGIPAKTVNLLDQIQIRKNPMGGNDIIPYAAALGLAMREIPWL
jgi:type IV pilus assembly protein PilM